MPEEVSPGDALELAVQAINEGQESTSDSEEQVASAEESQATDGEESAEEAAGESTEGSGSAYQKLLQKYGNDPEKLAAGVIEQQNSLSRMHSEIQEIRQALASRQEVEQAAEEEAEFSEIEHPDVEWINQELTDLKAESTEISATKHTLVQIIVALEKEIAEKRGESRRADDFDKSRLLSEIAQLESRKEAKAEQWQEQARREKQIAREEKEFNRRLRLAQQEVNAERSKLKELKRSDQARQSQTLNTFFTSFEAEAKGYALSPEMTRTLANDVRRDVVDYLRTLPAGTPEQDIPALTKWYVEQRVKLLNLSKRVAFATKSEQKLKAAAVVGKPPKNVSELTQRAKTSKDKLPDNWSKLSTAQKAKAASERARSILG